MFLNIAFVCFSVGSDNFHVNKVHVQYTFEFVYFVDSSDDLKVFVRLHRVFAESLQLQKENQQDMPLILMCGYPSSGKTTLCEKIKNYIENEHKKVVKVISENSLVDNAKNSIYGESTKEKSIRSALRGDVERYISRDTVVILDALNYIKGFRYELHCIVKAEKTLHCIIHCGIPKETCVEWNSQRSNNEKYAPEVFDALVMRFEEPDSRNRWDSPLFTKTLESNIDFSEIFDALYKRPPPPPNQSTIATPLSSGNFVRDLDHVTQSIIMEVLQFQKTAVVGDSLKLSNTTEKLNLTKIYNMAELRRLKRQYITYAKMHPVEDIVKLRNMFVQFLNNSIV